MPGAAALGAAALWCAYLVALGAGLLPHRRACALVLLGLAGALALAAVAEGGELRRLEVVHEHSAFVGNQVVAKDFPIEVVEAPGWQWAAAAAAYCAGLAAACWIGLPRRGRGLWPLVLAWSSTALVLVLEKLAAPPETVAFRLHLSVWLAAILAAVEVARARPRLLTYAATLLLVTAALWAPAGLFATLATLQGLGTSLDVHGIEFCAHPLARTPLTLEPASPRQLWYLVWAPLLVIYPLLTWLSAGGVGFMVLMAMRERGEAAARGRG